MAIIILSILDSGLNRLADLTNWCQKLDLKIIADVTADDLQDLGINVIVLSKLKV